MIKNPFKNGFSENIFRSKYAQGPNDTWPNLAERLVDDVCGTMGGAQHPILSKTEREYLVEIISDMKFIPGGRYLYYAGRPAHFWNNCLGRETTILTDKGTVTLDEVEGQTVNVLSPVDGKYYPAEIVNHGKQKLNKIVFAPVRGNSNITFEVRATRTHHWPLQDGTDTYDLRVGDRVPANTHSLMDWEGFVHGFVFGDGNANGQLRLCADKDKKWLDLLKDYGTVTYPESANGAPVLYFGKHKKWKELPEGQDPAYIAGFIRGWLHADGSEKQGNKLCSVDEKAIRWFRQYAAYAGIVVSGELRSQIRDVAIGHYSYNDHKIYIQNYAYGDSWEGFKVMSITEDCEEDVLCPYEPVHNKFILGNNIETFNCYLLKAEEDTREEWAALAQRAMSCLMTGGGIGIDYSALRESGRVLSRTGGQSSGPIPLMYCINEIGRNVMQGGSRRSAIYASLNWQHKDADDFLVAKNWSDMPIHDDLSIWDAKQYNFNYNAPLDMTNISLNYDNAWLQVNNELDATFLENCRQALSTGEPGFSFNFGDKEKETLRNAPLGGNTYVLTGAGYKTINRIIEDKGAWIWTGKQWVYTNFTLTKENANTVKVLMTGDREIVAEPSHEFFVERYVGKGNRRKLVSIDKVPAGELQEGDILHTNLPHYPDEFIQNWLNNTAYTWGYMYGDGSFRKEGGGEISLCTEESKACLQYMDKTMFSSITEEDGRGYTRCYVKTSAITYKDKAIWPQHAIPDFVAGVFDADGSYDAAQNRIRLASKYKTFLHGCRRYLESIGILSSVVSNGISTYGKTKTYALVINTEYVNEFIRLIPTQRLKIKNYTAYRKSTIKVISVKPDKKQNVYCCDVGVEEHAFQAEGVIVSNCTEITSEDDSDVCNLGSINIGRIETIEEFRCIVGLASKFLVCGTMRADLPYEKVRQVREKNRRLGLGIMGFHEWLLKRGYTYEVTDELKEWLGVYRNESESSANEHCERLYLSRPVAYRSIAPTGSIGILACTTTGIEPIYSVAYKRRYLIDKTKWKYEFVVDEVAAQLIKEYGLDSDKIETALSLAADPERRIKFQADIQDYVDMGISSTLNLPPWGSKLNNEDKVDKFAKIVAKYAPRLRGLTCYPDGARGGQPLTEISYDEALKHKGVVFEEHDACAIGGKGTCEL